MSKQTMQKDSLLIFEQPLLRVPYEQYRRAFRSTQRVIDKEFNTLSAAANDLATQPNTEKAAASLDAMIARVEALKRRLSDIQEASNVPIRTALRDRMKHVDQIENFASPDTPEFSAWADTRLDRWLVEWSLRNGRVETARALAQTKGIESLVDVDLFGDIQRIQNALRRQSCTEALQWCNENKATLRKMKSDLEFELRLQEYVELARSGKTVLALNYSKKHLLAWHKTRPLQFQQALGLLAFAPSSTLVSSNIQNPILRLYDASRWSFLESTFTSTAYSLMALPNTPLLDLALYAGLAALKHPACFAPERPPSHTNTTDPREYDYEFYSPKNPDCPICDGPSASTHPHSGSESGKRVHLSDGGLSLITERYVPATLHLNSTLVCALSGKVMNSDNPPMAFKNGNVYSTEALEDMASKNEGLVTCPRTGDTCNLGELRKVFIS
jgi:macrophage erythroblast attacher